MTATWEAAMRAIQEGTENVEPFVARVAADLGKLVEQGRAMGQLDVGGGHPCPKPGCSGCLRRIRGKKRPVLVVRRLSLDRRGCVGKAQSFGRCAESAPPP